MGFFDDLSKKASQTYKNTAEKTNKLTREMKLKSLINDDKTRIERLYIEIGRKVYEKHVREENIDIKNELIEECSKIDAYAKEIEDMRMEILELKNLRLCKKCAAEVPLNAKFCPKCGVALEENEDKNKDENSEAQQDSAEVIQVEETNGAKEVQEVEKEFQEISEVEIGLKTQETQPQQDNNENVSEE